MSASKEKTSTGRGKRERGKERFKMGGTEGEKKLPVLIAAEREREGVFWGSFHVSFVIKHTHKHTRI
jgi:hypothetical protein